jgi:hypothetical protein
MIASMFTGIAFASTPTAALQVSVAGAVARDGAIVITGALLPVGAALPADMYGVVLQRRAPGAAAGDWVNVPGRHHAIPTGGGTFTITHVLIHAGDYRLAAAGAHATPANWIALNATGGTATPLLTHTIGTVASHALSVTTTTPSVTWGLYQPGVGQQVTIPLTVTRVVGGVLRNFYDTVSVSSVTFNGAAAVSSLVSLSTEDIAAQVRRITVTQPTGALAAGPLVITLTAEGGESIGSVTVNVVPRDAFNIIVTPSATPTVGVPLANITVQAFDAAGNLPGGTGVAEANYTVSRITGPFAAPSPATLRVAGAGTIQWANITPRQGGDITVTTEFYNSAHALLATVTRTIPVAGLRLERPVTAVRRSDETSLRVIVTDAAGNRINNALVTFAGAVDQFAIRDVNTGEFVNTSAANLVVNGMLATQPRGSSVVNGEYAIDVRLRATGPIRVRVQTPTLVGDAIQWSADRINWANAIAVNATLGYTLTLDHTLLAGSADETVLVTVRDAAGAFVSSGLTFTFTDPAGVATTTLTSFVPSGNGVWSLRMNASAAGSYTITATNTAATITGTATITAVAPVVAVTPDAGLLTQNFYDVVTVTVTDPRTNVAVARNITIAPREVATPLHTTAAPNRVATAINFEAQNREVGTTVWAGTGAVTDVSSRQFRVLASPATAAARTIAGVVHPPQVSITVPGAAAVHLTLAPATLQVTPGELFYNRQNDVTVRLIAAHGAGMASSFTASGAFTLASTTLPAAGLTLRVRPEPGVVFAPEATFTVTPPLGTALTVAVPVVLPPADAVAPVLTTNAPATTTAATLPVTITATDNVAVTRIIVDGVDVAIIPAASVSVVRTLPLVVGANNFVVQAADAAGNVTAITITITRTEPPAPPRDTVAPTIEVTAPSVTTDANAMITIVARDNVAVTGIIFEGAPVSIFPGATVTIMRTVTLREGLNSFALSVTDAAGNVTNRIIVIDRRMPAPVVHTITIGRANPAIGLDVPANVRNGRLMVPFRWFAERILNATVDFKVVGAAEIVTMHRGNMHVELTLNSTIAKVNGVPVALDVAPFATGGRTLVPARFLAETFGYIVNWNPVTDEVTFTVRP